MKKIDVLEMRSVEAGWGNKVSKIAFIGTSEGITNITLFGCLDIEIGRTAFGLPYLSGIFYNKNGDNPYADFFEFNLVDFLTGLYQVGLKQFFGIK